MSAVKKQQRDETQQQVQQRQQALARLLQKVQQDAKQRPQAYLEECRVPEGGE